MTLKWFLTINNNVKKCIKETKCSVPKSHLTVYDPMDCSPSDSSVHGDSPGKKTRVGCHFLLQQIFQTRNGTHVSYVLSCQASPLPLVLPGSPKRQ